MDSYGSGSPPERVGCSTERLIKLPSVIKCLQLFCGIVATACAGAALSCTVTNPTTVSPISPITTTATGSSQLPNISTSLAAKTTTIAAATTNTITTLNVTIATVPTTKTPLATASATASLQTASAPVSTVQSTVATTSVPTTLSSTTVITESTNANTTTTTIPTTKGTESTSTSVPSVTSETTTKPTTPTEPSTTSKTGGGGGGGRRRKRAADATTTTTISPTTTARSSWSASLSYSTVEAYGQGWVMFVGSVCIILTFALWVIDTCNIRRVHMRDQWTQFEFFYTIAAVILYIMAFGVEAWYASTGGWQPNAIYHGCYWGTWQASAAFAFFNVLLYITGIVIIVRERHAMQ